MKTFDLVIIGWGKGGKTLAASAAARGESVAVIERDAELYGGTCINVGCIPSKSLVTSAERGKWGEAKQFEDKARYYREAIAEKRRLTAMLRSKMYHKLADAPTVEVFNGIGSFVSAREVAIAGGAGTEVISGRRIVIDTGSTPVIPAISGIAGNPLVYTSRELLDCDQLPEKLVIIGGGYIGMEFASIYSGFGSAVTVIQDGNDFLPREDRDIAAEIAKVLTGRGVKMITGFHTAAITHDAGIAKVSGIDANAIPQEFSANAVLIATGRRPNTADLHVERAGIGLTARGGIVVDEFLRTAAPEVWAVGDAVGNLQFTYVSLDDSRIVAPQLFGGTVNHTTATRQNVPNSVFLDPPFSRVGLNEQEARDRALDVTIAKMPAAAIPKAQVLRQTEGMLKVVIDNQSGQILGAMLFCAESHELINLLKVAMDAKIPYTVLRDNVYTHPTMSEALNDLFTF